MVDAVAFAAASRSARSRRRSSEQYRGYRFRATTPGAARERRARGSAGTSRGSRSRAAAADANVFNERGLPCVNLANGMVDIHTPDERIAVDDLERMVDVTLALVDARTR